MYFPMILLPRMHAQRGKVIGSVIVVVVSTKIARSRVLGEFASANCSQGVMNRKKTRERANVRRGCAKGTTKAINHASC